MKRILAFVSAFMLVLALASVLAVPVAFAHAQPKDCTPAIDGTVDVAPTLVVCKTGQAMDPENSSMSVFNAAGEQVDAGDSAVDLNDPDRLTISVSLDPAKITDGVYTVKWATLSADDNEDADGEFTFTVKLAGEGAMQAETQAASETPAATETAAAAAAPAQVTETPTPAEATTLPTTGNQLNYGSYALIAVAGLTVLSAGAYVLARARN